MGLSKLHRHYTDQTAPKEQSDRGIHCLPLYLNQLDAWMDG